jgi:hypothetical protein
MITTLGKLPGIPGFSQILSDTESPEQKNVPRITEQLRFNPLRFGIPEVNHLEESTPKHFVPQFDTGKVNNYVVEHQNKSPFTRSMQNTVGNFYKSDGSKEIKDGVEITNSATKKGNEFQTLRCPSPERSFKKRTRLGTNSRQVFRGKGFPSPVLDTRESNEAIRLTEGTPRLSERMALDLSGNKPKEFKNNFFSDTPVAPVNGLQLLASHIGHLAGKMPKLLEGERSKLQRARSTLEKQKKANIAVEDDWE